MALHIAVSRRSLMQYDVFLLNIYTIT